MRFFKIIIFNILLFVSLNALPHNPEDFIIAEIEEGQPSTATPTRTDKREGHKVGSTFCIFIPQVIDKDKGLKEPTQKE